MHGGRFIQPSLSSEERTEYQSRFIRDDAPVLVATIAFGMGIGKPDVRAVIQADERVSHGTVVHVMDQLKKAGIAKIAFGVTQDYAK